MNKKQLIGVSTVAAVPAVGLLVLLVIGLTQGMLSASPSPSAALWVVWILAVLGSVAVGFLPIAIMIFPGLLPQPGELATAGAASAEGSPVPVPSRKKAEDDEFEESGDFDEEYSDSEGDEEQTFEDDFGDDFDEMGDFEEEEK